MKKSDELLPNELLELDEEAKRIETSEAKEGQLDFMKIFDTEIKVVDKLKSYYVLNCKGFGMIRFTKS